MILDNALTLVSPNITTRTSDGTGAGQYNSDDQIDLSARRDIAEGHPIKAILHIPVTFGGGAGSSINVTLWSADDTALTNATFYQGFNNLTKDSGALDGGKTYEITLNPPSQVAGTTLRRFLFMRVNAIGAANNFTGTNIVRLHLLLDTQDGRTFYTSGFSIA